MLNAQDGNHALVRLIGAEIEKRGPMSFARFMHQVLYHPEHGYYSSGRCAIGRNGDYFTSVSVGPLFGQLLCAQFGEIWERLGKPNNFVILEQGAHDGQFAHDVLGYAQKRAPEFFAALRYQIVEPFPVLRERQSRMLKRFRGKIEHCDSVQSFAGVHFSNELLDAMPVRLISDGVEKFVDLEGDKFVLIECPLSREAAAFNQPVLDWIDDVARNLQAGYVIAIDYGRFGDEFEANLQVRAQHRHLDSPFEQMGHADITMQVDWLSIIERARANGMRVAGFTDQHHFLTGIISELGRVDSSESFLIDSPKTTREVQTLLHAEMLGRAFQVMGLEKNVDPRRAPLAGFKFARDCVLR